MIERMSAWAKDQVEPALWMVGRIRASHQRAPSIQANNNLEGSLARRLGFSLSTSGMTFSNSDYSPAHSHWKCWNSVTPK